MADIRVSSTPDASREVGNVTSEGDGGGRSRGEPRGEHERQPRTGAEELAVALSTDGGAAMEAHYAQGPDGEVRIRIVDGERHETVALLTPEELRELAISTGLPPGMLVQTST